MDNDDYQKKTSTIVRVIKNGAAITGAGIAGAVGTLALGPVGGAAVGAGSAVIQLLVNYGIDLLIGKTLSKNEEVKVGASLSYVIYKIDNYLQEGLTIRQDDFFDSRVNNYSKAEEIFEGVITKSQIEYQLKKIQFISNIFANAAFTEDTSVEELHHILEIADRLTYREICILALITKEEIFNSIGKEKIGLIFPTEYAFEPREQNSLVDRWTIYPHFERSSDFYFLHQELTRLNELNLIGPYYWSYPVDKNKLPTHLRKENLEHSVFLYDFSRNTHPFTFKLSEIMGLNEIDEVDLNQLRKNIVAPVTLKAKTDKEILGVNTFVSQPSFLVNNSSSN